MKPRFLRQTTLLLWDGTGFHSIYSRLLPSNRTDLPYADWSKIHEPKRLTIKFI